MGLFKKIARACLRFYLVNTPIRVGRYPLMMAGQRFLGSSDKVTVKTKDRGLMVVELNDLMQFPIYYGIYESKYDKAVGAFLSVTEVAFDVGGNIGQYALLFAQHAKKVYTFEPMPSMIARLQEHIRLNSLEDKLILVTKALSNTEGTLKFALPDQSNTGTASTIVDNRVAQDLIAVEATTFDRFVETNGISKVDLVKMDIEGAELFALQGMQRSFENGMRPILILEMNESMMKLAGYSFGDVQRFLARYDYAPYAMVKQGLVGPCETIVSSSENFAFLTGQHAASIQLRNLITASPN